MAIAAGVLGFSGCTGDGQGRPDEELGTLVVSPTSEVEAIDIDGAAKKADTLLSVVQRPHTWLAQELGSHVLNATSTVEVREGGEVVNELGNSLTVDFDGEGRFSAVLETNNDYGRHAIFDGTSLYLRPRFGLYHKRAPQTETEAAEIRTLMAREAGDYLELLERGLEVSDLGEKTRDGRAVRRVALKLAPKARKLAAEPLAQKKWRDSIVVKTLSGQVDIDAETGAALYLEVDGSISFERDGRNFQMRVQAEQQVTEIGHSRAIAAPSDEEVMLIPARRRELDERNTLLRNIAPPARRAPTPAAAQAAP